MRREEFYKYNSAGQKELINEAKNVGIIYHFTTLDSIEILTDAKKMKEFGCEIFTFVSNNGHLSTTRDFMLSNIPLFKLNPSKYNVRIAIDGNKLSNKYKIKPLSGLAHDNTEIFGTDLNHIRVPHKSEKEEVVCPLKGKTSFDIKDYILEVQFYQHSQESFDKYEEVKERLKHTNIIVNRVRKWLPFKEHLEDVDWMDDTFTENGESHKYYFNIHEKETDA